MVLETGFAEGFFAVFLFFRSDIVLVSVLDEVRGSRGGDNGSGEVALM